jgi:hypothetical protein
MENLKALVSQLSYCRDSMETYPLPNGQGTGRRNRETRQKKLEKVYSELKGMVKGL